MEKFITDMEKFITDIDLTALRAADGDHFPPMPVHGVS